MESLLPESFAALDWILAAVLLFFAAWFALRGLIPSDGAAMQLLMAAYFVHLTVRTVWLSLRYHRGVLDKCPQNTNLDTDGKA